MCGWWRGMWGRVVVWGVAGGCGWGRGGVGGAAFRAGAFAGLLLLVRCWCGCCRGGWRGGICESFGGGCGVWVLWWVVGGASAVWAVVWWWRSGVVVVGVVGGGAGWSGFVFIFCGCCFFFCCGGYRGGRWAVHVVVGVPDGACGRFCFGGGPVGVFVARVCGCCGCGRVVGG